MSGWWWHLYDLSPFHGPLVLVYGALVLGALVFGVRRGATPHPWGARVLSLLLWLGLAIGCAVLTERGIAAGRAPFRTLYESLVLFAVCTNAVLALVDLRFRHPVLLIPASALLLGVSLYAAWKPDLEAIALPPALQSAFFVPHVVVYFLGYGALAVGAVAALLALVAPRFALLAQGPDGPVRLHASDLMHRLNLLGFVLIGAGLVVGAFWAKQAWGDWWSWDPKENWSLVTWLVYVLYLHIVRLPGFATPRRLALVTLIGFAAVMFTYLGIHLLPTGTQSQHAYQ